jgi:hypothetical protein
MDADPDAAQTLRRDRRARGDLYVAAFNARCDFALYGARFVTILVGVRNGKRVEPSEKGGDRCALDLPV